MGSVPGKTEKKKKKMRKRKEKESGMTLSQAQQGLCPAHVDVHSDQTEVLI